MGGDARDARGASRRRARCAVGNVSFRAIESFARLRVARRASNVVDGARSGGEAATWILAATDRAGDSTGAAAGDGETRPGRSRTRPGRGGEGARERNDGDVDVMC